MAIRAETEIRHDVLGPLRFDDGSALPEIPQRPSTPPQWVARPGGWDPGDFEFYLAGGPGGPDPVSLNRAIMLAGLLDQIEQHARQISGSELELAWIDCTAEAPTVALYDPSDVYLLWEGTLDKDLHLANLGTRNW